MFAKSIETSGAATLPAPASPRQVALFVALVFSILFLAITLHDRGHLLRLGADAADAAVAAVTDVPAKVGFVKPVSTPKPDPEALRQQVIAEFLAKRYKVAQSLMLDFVEVAHAEGKRTGIDPLLIMAMIGIESRYNPIAESEMGAKGLMQIIPKFHMARLNPLGGEQAVFDPKVNIRVGAEILREYYRMTGNLGSALQMYAGALEDPNDTYANRVMGEKQRLRNVVSQHAARVAQNGPVAVGG